MKLLLSKFPWVGKAGIYVTGFIVSGGMFLRNEELVGYFADVVSSAAFVEKLKKANGQFSVVIDRGDELWAATDRIRNWPLFYTRIGDQYYLSDDCYRLAALRNENEFDAVSYNCFLAAGYTINDRTLLKDIFQVEAGGLIILGNEARSHYYHNPAIEKSVNADMEKASVELTGLTETVFREYFTALKDKFIAIPLSGGYDSRLVALMASKYHPENILCYKYGREDNPEIRLAEETAGRLGLRWIKIIYDKALIRDYINDGYFKEYNEWVSGLTGMFFLQEYFAVRYLKSHNLVPGNTVFISGFSGDFIAGSYVTRALNKKMSSIELSHYILKEYFRLIPQGRKMRNSLSDLIRERIPVESCEAWKVVETWDMKERHAKFIINSAKVFTFFGYEYVFPLWDNRLVDFMLALPVDLRVDRKLYEHALKEDFFVKRNLNFSFETNPVPARKRIQRIKESVKPFIPSVLKEMFTSRYNAVFYDEITRILIEDAGIENIKPPKQKNYYNSYIIQWYLLKCSEKFNIRAD